jgi:hypothetical protein
MNTLNDTSPGETLPSGHEPVEANVRAVWITGSVLTGIVVAAFLLIFALQSWLETTNYQQPMPATTGADSITNPDWNVPPQVQQLRTKEQQFLSTYAWVDQTSGVARIPLDRALEIITKDGLPTEIGNVANPPAPDSNE